MLDNKYVILMYLFIQDKYLKLFINKLKVTYIWLDPIEPVESTPPLPVRLCDQSGYRTIICNLTNERKICIYD